MENLVTVEIDSRKHIYNLTEEQMEQIKNDLTIENPAYIQVKKYSKWQNTKVPKYLFYYRQQKSYSGNSLVVPSGYKLPFSHDVIDNRIEVTVDFPQFKLELRDTQKEAFNAYIEDTDDGIIVLPTGKGKSVLGMYIAYRLRQKTLVVVHKDDLVSGWKADAELCFGGELKTGLIKAQKRNVGEQITIATIQTLNRLSPEDLEALTKEFGLIIVDEMHHISSRSFDLLHEFSCAYKMGLSATPEREDGLTNAMFYHLGAICFQYKSDENDKDILPVHVIFRSSRVVYEPEAIARLDKKGNTTFILYDPKKHIGLETIKLTDIPYKERPRINYHEVEDKIMNTESYMSLVCNDIQNEYEQGRSCVAFFSKKEHIRLYHDYLLRLGVPKERIMMYYGDATESKEDMKNKAESKEVLVTLATYAIATEGTNVKAWEVAFLVSSINNEKNTEQAVGRIRRTKAGKINPVLVYDYQHKGVYAVSNHINTRIKRYKQLGFKFEREKSNNKVISRGWNR